MKTLESVLLNTLNKEEAVRKQAEHSLRDACAVPGFTVSLLKIACENQNPKEIRQAASVALKNGIKRNWTTEDLTEQMRNTPQQSHFNEFSGKYNIPKGDRDLVRSNIMAGLAMIRSDNESIRKVLSECVGSIAEWDFPDRWPGLIQELINLLSPNNDRDCVYNGLLALRCIVKRYEFTRRPRKARLDAESKLKGGKTEKEKNKRDPLDRIVDATFPILLEYGSRFVQMDDDFSASMLRLIAKVFYSATRLELPPPLQNATVSEKWFSLWEKSILKPLSPLQGEGDDIDDLSLRPWWKVKKGALEIAVRIFQECVKDPTFVSDDDLVTKQFTTFFIDGGIATSFLLAATKLLENWARNNKPLPSKILQLSLSYCSIAMEPSKTYKILRPNLQFLIDDVVLKCLSFTENDWQEWYDDPEAYACHELDPLDDIFDPKATAANLLIDSCRLRSKDILDSVVEFLFAEMTKRSSPSKQDACLFAVGALAEILAPPEILDSEGQKIVKKTSKRVEKYKAHLEEMIGRFVVPELSATEPHLRARACWVVGRYAHVNWKDFKIAQLTFGRLLDRLGDVHLPVQAQAASSLKNVLILDPDQSLGAKALREIALSHLGLIIRKYLEIMSKIGADDVVAGLQALISAFPNEIAPMAADICQALVEAYFHYTSEEDEEGDRAAAAFETLDAINSLMDCAASSKNPELLLKMEPVVTPLLNSVISPNAEIIDYLENAVTTYSYLTYYAPLPLSDNLWSFVGKIKQCFDANAYDYLSDFIIPLEHLAFRDPDRFFHGTDPFLPNGITYAASCFEICKKILDDVNGEDGAGEMDIRSASSLLCAILQSAPSKEGIPVELCCKEATYWLFTQDHTELSSSTQAKLFEIVESCFYLAPQETRAVFGQHLFIGLMKLRDCLKNHHQLRKKKIAVLGLSALLREISGENDPKNVGLVVAECVELLDNIQKQRQFLQIENEEDDGEEVDLNGIEEFENDEYDEEDEEFDEDENAVDDEEAAYKQFLRANGDFGGAWGDIDDDEVEDEDPEDYPWPLDKVDEIQIFNESVKFAFARNPALVQQSVSSLDDSVKTVLARLVPELK